MIKKLIVLSLIATITFTISTQANQIQNEIQQLYNEIIPPYKPILKEQCILVEKLKGTLWEEFFTDHEREAFRRDPVTKEFLKKFYIFEPQAMGIDFCHECLQKKENPSVKDLQTCFEKWLENDDRARSFDLAAITEKTIKCDRELRSSLHQGNHIFEKRIRKIIKENS